MNEEGGWSVCARMYALGCGVEDVEWECECVCRFGRLSGLVVVSSSSLLEVEKVEVEGEMVFVEKIEEGEIIAPDRLIGRLRGGLAGGPPFILFDVEVGSESVE